MPLGRILIWGIPLVLYTVFWLWYTPLGGAITDEEVSAFKERLRENNMDLDTLAAFEDFFSTDDGGQFIMVNILDMTDDPETLPATGPGATALDLLDHYMEHMYAELLGRASHPVFAGVAVADSVDLVGIEGAEQWQTAALMRYRSRRDLMEILMNPKTVERHDYKIAALEKTIAFPVRPQLFLSDPRLILALLFFAVACLLDLVVTRIQYRRA